MQLWVLTKALNTTLVSTIISSFCLKAMLIPLPPAEIGVAGQGVDLLLFRLAFRRCLLVYEIIDQPRTCSTLMVSGRRMMIS